MAKIVAVDDYKLYSEMVVELLTRHGGHQVKGILAPVILEEITDFDPDLVVITLVRRLEAIGHGPLYDFYAEVDGARTWRSLASKEAFRHYPVIVAVIGVRESEIPADLAYLALVHVPHELEMLLTAIDKIVEAKARGSRPGEA